MMFNDTEQPANQEKVSIWNAQADMCSCPCISQQMKTKKETKNHTSHNNQEN